MFDNSKHSIVSSPEERCLQMSNILQSVDDRPYYELMNVKVHFWKTDKHNRERFRIRWSFKGKQYEITRDDSGEQLIGNRKKAEAVASKIALEIESKSHDPSKWLSEKRNKFHPANAISFFLEKRKKDHERNRITGKHYRDIELHLTTLKNYCSEAMIKDIRDLKGLELQNMFDNHLKEMRYSTLRKYRTSISSFFNWAQKKSELLDKFPVLPDIGEEEAVTIKYLTQDQQTKVLKYVPTNFKPIIKFLMLYGCRPSEAIAVQLDDVNLIEKTILIRRTVNSDGLLVERTKTNKIRSLPILDEILSTLEKEIKNRIGKGYLFINHDNGGKRFTIFQLDKMWREATKSAGLSGFKLVEGTRKSVTDNALKKGIDLETISGALGNSPKVLLKHYGQISANRNLPVFGNIIPLKKKREKRP